MTGFCKTKVSNLIQIYNHNSVALCVCVCDWTDKMSDVLDVVAFLNELQLIYHHET